MRGNRCKKCTCGLMFIWNEPTVDPDNKYAGEGTLSRVGSCPCCGGNYDNCPNCGKEEKNE